MPVLFQKVYYREDARRNPDVLYVFGDNVRRIGLGGQAKEMRHEPNAIGVATLYAPGDYFGSDRAEVVAQNRIVDQDMKPLFAQLVRGGIVVWPTDGIGTGLANLETYAPDTFQHVREKLAALIRVGKLFDRGRVEEAKSEAAPHLS